MNTNLVNITELTDSLSQVIPIIRSIEEHSAPAPFTYINIIISLIAALFGFGSFLYAKKTADNVSRLSRKTQIDLCKDLLLDSLQIVVRQLVALKRIEKDGWVITEDTLKDIDYWPSEIYFKQDVYNSQSKIYKMIYNIKRRMQEYNKKILDCQQDISKGKRIGKEKLTELYENNWMNLYKAYAIYEKLNMNIYEKLNMNIYEKLNKIYEKLNKIYEKLNRKIYEKLNRNIYEKLNKIYEKLNRKIYEKLNRKIKPKPGAAPKKIKKLYFELHNAYVKKLEKKKIILDENRKRTYNEIIVELYNNHKQKDDPWSDIRAIEMNIADELSKDAALHEETKRIEEGQQSAT